jgi:2-polyprenyl-3-methyl-5-hydroxy-6-metoxy-1,4-benzoquinol methylase
MNLSIRSYEKELLDREDIPFADIEKNMQELAFINTWLGGHRISILGLKQLLQNRTSIHICEIGCGGGDNLLALFKWCRLHNIKVIFTGIDINRECITVAENQLLLKDQCNWVVSDFSKVVFDSKPDIIFSSLFCHHFTDNELVHQLHWMKENSTIGFFINDLQRHWLAYYSIRILTRLFSSSYLVKNDAPLSVTRGFTRKEWITIFTKAGIRNYSIQWRRMFRYLVIYKHEL